jgi:L,D-transpeptidase YbiS
MKIRKILLLAGSISLGGLIGLITITYSVSRPKASSWRTALFNAAEETKPAAKLASENRALKRNLGALGPRGYAILIDSAENKLYLMKDGKLLREAVVSCGSGSILEDPGGKRMWIFDTPRGEFFIRYKLKDPDWVKPDWAFIEEGKEPPRNQADRVESGTLGDFALGFGDGYFIHGTLYTRLLGRNVTHGCVRVGDKDLEFIYQTAPVGTKIYIY